VEEVTKKETLIMVDKFIEIKITKATLFLTEKELLRNLPPEVIKTALQRGKAILRRRQYEARVTKEVDTLLRDKRQ
jgi:adenylate kinase